jgi:CRP-like cAMP-binding protein
MPPDDYLSHASGEEFNYSHMSTEERALFTKVMFRWFSKAANDQLALLVDGWMVWRKRDKYLQAKAQNSLYSRRSLDAANIMRDMEPEARSIDDLTAMYQWGKLTSVFESIGEVTIRTIMKKTKVRDLQQGQALFYQGEPPDAFWIVLTGSLSLFVLKNKDDERRIQKKYRDKDLQALCLTQELLTGALGKEVGAVASGAGVGELSLLGLGSKDRACSAVASEPTCMIMLDISEYNRFLRKGHMARMDLKSKVEFVQSVHLFSHWRREDVNRLVYGLKDVEYIRGTKLLEVGQDVTKLLLIFEGNVSLMHPRGNVNLALLGARDVVGNDALYHHLSNRRTQGAEPLKARFEVSASTMVKGYVIEVEELAKFCTGGHGMRTHKVLSTTLKLQERQRRSHFKRARRWQKRISAEKEYREELKKGLLYRLEEVKGRIETEEVSEQLVGERITFEDSTPSFESIGLRFSGQPPPLSDQIRSPHKSLLQARPPSLPVIGVGGKQFPFNDPTGTSSVAWAGELSGKTPTLQNSELPDLKNGKCRLGSIRIRDRHLPTLAPDPSGGNTIKEMPLPPGNCRGKGLAATTGWEAKLIKRMASRSAEDAPMEGRVREATKLLKELKLMS